MEPTVTVMKENGKCSFYIDDFSGFTSTSKYANEALQDIIGGS